MTTKLDVFAEHARLEAAARAEKQANRTAVKAAKSDPRIGELCRKGKVIYYAYAPYYVESESRRAVAQKLVDMDMGC